jgi:two-component system sensor histidine kinase BaeS
MIDPPTPHRLLLPRPAPSASAPSAVRHASVLPRLTLSKKVFMAMATLLALLLLIFTTFSIVGLQRGLGPYVAEIEVRRMDWLAEALQKKYASDGSWEPLRADRSAWMRLQWGEHALSGPFASERRLPRWYDRRLPADEGAAAEGPPPFEPLFFRSRSPDEGPRGGPDAIYQRLGVTDAAGTHVAGARVDPASAARLPLRHLGHTIGYLVLAPTQVLESQADRAFLARQAGFIALTGLAGLALALALSWFVARGWLADVAHELRTPLAAMRAEIEALQDGVRQFDDRTALRLHRQVMRLGQLVDDLRSSMREPEPHGPHASGAAFAPIYPLALLAEAVEMMRGRFAQRGLVLDSSGLGALAVQPAVDGDAPRLHQVFMNLLENSLDYTDPGGSLRLGAATEGSGAAARLLIRFDDSAPGPLASEMPRLFDRLFRGEASRSRETGGSGLGLSICRTLVEAHGGAIDASPSPLRGLRILITLPLSAHP